MEKRCEEECLMNCVECQHYRIETHIAPSIGTCSAVDSQLGCEKCKAFSPIAAWKHCGAGKIKCPECRTQQSIPLITDWRHGCCTLKPSATVVNPFMGKCPCTLAEPITVPAAPEKPKQLARSLFD